MASRPSRNLADSSRICTCNEFISSGRPRPASDFAAGSANPPKELLTAFGGGDDIQLDAPPTVAANFAMVNGAPHVYLVNFGGLVPGKVVVPTPVNIQVKVPAAMGDSLSYLPFLGEEQRVHGVRRGEQIEFTLPPLERGAVVSFAAKQ